jgi:uncharacterized protein (UPF0332 family)
MTTMSKYSDEIKLNLERSVTNLQAAKELSEKSQYDAAASRAAESAFHAGSALLLDEGIETSKHGDVIAMIHQIFVNGRRLTKEQGGDLSWLFALRDAEDRRASIHVASEAAHKAVQIAESFFAAAKVILDS